MATLATCDDLDTCEYMLTSVSDPSVGHNLSMAMNSQVITPPHLLEYGVDVVPPLHCYNQPGRSDSSPESHSEAPAPKASDRESRIKAEKQRRSQFNSLISELMSLLPANMRSQRKIDKTSVLRLAANELRNIHVFGDSVKCCHIESWSKVLSVLDLLGGFLISVTCRGRIFNVSPNIQEKLGHCHVDLLGHNIYDYIHPDDVDILRENIYPQELHLGIDNNTLTEEHCDFCIRVMRSGPRSDPPRYEYCHFDGSLRKADKATSNGVQDEQIIKRQRVRYNRTFSSSGNDFVFIGMVRVESQTVPVQLMSPYAHSEYWTRHLMDGRIVQVDQSISLVAGYMTEEVTGASAFFFMHKEDVRWVICVLRQMYDQSKEFGESYYRLMSRTGNFLYMRTRGFLEIDPKTKQVQSFVCINSVISEDYGKRMLEEMKLKFSVIVSKNEGQTVKQNNGGEVPVEHPQCLERIVMHLVEPSHSDNPDPLKIVAPSKDNIVSAIKTSERVVSETGINFYSRKRKIDNDKDDNNKRKCLS